MSSIISSVGWGLFQIGFIYILTARTSTVFGWTRYQLIVLAVSYNIGIGLFHFLFSRNFDRFSRMIDYGELDTLLVKPCDSQFLVSFWYVGYSSLIRVIIGIGILWWVILQMGMTITINNILGFIVLLLFGIILLYSIWFMVSTLIMWSPRLTNLIDFLYTMNGVAKYPTEMIRQVNNVMFYVLVPFTFVIATPTKALFGKVLSGDIFLLITLSILLLFLSRKFWHFALRSYTSANG